MAARRKIDWSSLPLGKVSDSQIARELGIRYGVVSYHRKRLGIKGLHPGPPKKKDRIDWDKVPLGAVPDKDIAEQLGCHWTNVYEQRKKRGIPRFNQRSKCVCGKPTVRGSIWCTTTGSGKTGLRGCAYKIMCARKWCGINRPRGGSWSSRNHALDGCFLALYELIETTKRVLGRRKIKT